MGIGAICPKREITGRNVKNGVFPYLLQNLKTDHPMQVRPTDISSVPMTNGEIRGDPFNFYADIGEIEVRRQCYFDVHCHR